MIRAKVLFYETIVFGIANIFTILSPRDFLSRGSFGVGGEIIRKLLEVEREKNTGYEY